MPIQHTLHKGRVAPGWEEHCSNNENPGQLASRMKVDVSDLIAFTTSGELPAHAKVRSDIKLPGLAALNTKVKIPSHPRDRNGSNEPSTTRSEAKVAKSRRLPPKIARGLPARTGAWMGDAGPRLPMPQAEAEDPIQAKPCKSEGAPKCKKSGADIAKSRRNMERVDEKLAMHPLSKAGSRNPAQAKLRGAERGSKQEASGTRALAPDLQSALSSGRKPELAKSKHGGSNPRRHLLRVETSMPRHAQDFSSGDGSKLVASRVSIRMPEWLLPRIESPTPKHIV